MILPSLLLLAQLAFAPIILHPKPLKHPDLRDSTHNYVVIHSTESEGNPLSVINYFRHTGKSSHFLISRTGVIYQLIPLEYQASHAGWSLYHGLTHFNKFSIGIEFMAGKGQDFTEAQYHSGLTLIRSLETRYSDLDSTRIVTHAQIAFWRGRKHDPAPIVQIRRLIPLDKP